MFENVLGQAAAAQLIRDIEAGSLAPAMLFSGPPASGKGTAALELGRVVSCEAGAKNAGAKTAGANFAEGGFAAWNCGCPACSRHRFLIHPDLLCLGWKPFVAEISASAGAFLRDSASRNSSVSGGSANSPSRILFLRSVRKLLARFNPVLWEDDPRRSKVSPLVASLEENLDELEQSGAGTQDASPEKLTEQILKSAVKLDSEAMSENIPVGHLRRAAWWSRLAPSGRWKLLIVENADLTQVEGRNSLLKLLEEPPGRMSIVLTTARPGSLLPTILSRLRPYRFGARDAAAEDEVIRRVFRDDVRGIRLSDYLDSFLPVSGETLEALASFYAASAAYKAVLISKKQGRKIAEEVVLLGKYCAPKAEAAGLGRPLGEISAVSALILERAEKFEIRSLFSRFLRSLLDQVSASLKQAPSSFLPALAFHELWRDCTAWAESAVEIYELKPPQALEKLFTDLSRGMAEL